MNTETKSLANIS